MSDTSVAEDDTVTALKVLARDAFVTLHITGAPKVQIRYSGSSRTNVIVPEIAELSLRNGILTTVAAIGPTIRKDGNWGLHRTALWSWQTERESVPEWLADLAVAEMDAS